MKTDGWICDSSSVLVVDKTLRRILNMTGRAEQQTLTLRTITLVPAPYAMVSPSGEMPIFVALPRWVYGFGKKLCSMDQHSHTKQIH